MLLGSNVEIASHYHSCGPLRCAVFDFDGTISLMRRGWRGVMSQLMLEVVTGGRQASASLRDEISGYIQESAGIQTIYQMQYLVDLTRKHGLIAENRIATAQEYKNIYSDRLTRVVDEQLRKLKDGTLPRDSLLVPGILNFLDMLKDFRVRLYAASGTDRSDVMREAAQLGIDRYFHEIYGPDISLPEYSKDWFIAKALEWNKIGSGQLLVVGDGPVEISAAKKHGSLAIGVASTEMPDGGLNHAKRMRLLKAGADIIIPDFSSSQILIDFLFKRQTPRSAKTY
jgi:phosphoglycolate phosphatase-like HAD superfamily hydrolase